MRHKLFSLAMFGVAASTLVPGFAQQSPARAQQAQAMLGQLQVCDTSSPTQRIDVCERALAAISQTQSEIGFVNELMLSYLAEVSVRSILADTYLADENIAKHCEHAEKAWSTRKYASEYANHPAFADISGTANLQFTAVQTCRSIAGAPPWGAPIE